MCMTGYILSRFHSELFLETLAEIRRIIESHHVAYLIDAVLVFQQEGSRFLQSDNLNHFIRRRIGHSFDFHKNSGTGDRQLLGQEVDRHFFVVQVLFNQVVHFLQEHFITLIGRNGVDGNRRHL